MPDQTPPRVILIADDDSDDRLLMREAFEERCPQSRLWFAQDGVHLMRILKRESASADGTTMACRYPDLIMLDLNMPLKDGREALLEIKSNPALRIIPTIVMTTSADDDDIRYCYDTGANSYIIKPTSYLELLDVVSSITHYWTKTVSLSRRAEYDDQ